GFKYNPPNGGPADTEVTAVIEKRANEILEQDLAPVKRMAFERAKKAPTTQTHDFVETYLADLANVIDFEAIRASGLSIGVDPMGGSGLAYWRPLAERFGL